jgi:hypothetical protein
MARTFDRFGVRPPEDAAEERQKEKIAEHDLAMELIKTGYKILASELRPKLPIDQKQLKKLRAVKKRLEQSL